MKINFSNLAKLFLAGVCFVAVGCTDYGQDIENLNNRITALETDTIDPLKADLEKTKETLAEAQKAIADHATQHAADVAALQQADEALQAAVDAAATKAAEDLKALADELKAADAKLAGDLAKAAEDLQNGIDAVNKKADDNKAAIEKAVADAAAALAALSKELKDADDALSKKIDAAVETLNGEIAKTNASVAALEAALNAAKAALEQSIADAKADLLAADATLKAELESKIATLETALNKTVADLEAKVDAEVARIDVAVQTNASTIAALQTALAETDARLQAAIKAGDDKLAADLKEAEAKLTQMIQDHVNAVNAEIAKIYDEISALKTVDEGLQKQITDLVAALAVTNQNVADNAAAIAVNKDAIAALNEALDTHVAEFLTFKATTEASIAALQAEIALLKEKDAELAALIEALDTRLTANEALAAQNAQDIKANKELFDAFVVATNETLELLKAADVKLQSNIDALDAALKAHQAAIRAGLEQFYGEFAAHQAETEAEFAKVNAAIAANDAAIQANAQLIADNKAAIAANAAAIEALDGRLTDLEKAHADLKAAHESLLANFTAYKAETTAAINSIKEEQIQQNKTISLHSEQIAALQESVKKLDEKVEKYYTELKNMISDLETSLKALIENVAADVAILKGRIQSLVFVPEYSDGKATIEYAKAGNAIVEGESKFLYQVHPAECVAAVSPADLQFVFTDALKSRSTEPMLEVVAVNIKNPSKGIIEVVAKAHNLHAIYEGSKEYAVSLVFSHKVDDVENNIASCYTTLIAEKASEVTEITWKLNDGYTKAAELEYISTGKVNVLGGIDYIFYENGEEQSHDYIFAHYGLTVKPVEIAPTYNNDEYTSALDNSVKASKGVFNNVVREDHGYDVSIALPKPDKNTVGLVQTIGYGFNLITVNNNAVVDSLSDYATVEITKIKGHMTLDPQTITWARSKDNDTDGITPKVPTSREVTTVAGKLLGVNGEELTTAGTTYADIITGTAAIKVNNEPLAAPYNVVFGGTTDAPTVLFEGFEWDKEYTIVASYEIDNIVAEISIVLTTVQNESVVTLDPATITWNYAADKASEKGEATFRAVEVKADNADLYADVIANGKLVSITPATGFVFTAAGIEATGFDWNSTYAVEALYAIEDQLVTVKVAVETVKAPFVDLTINLAPAQWQLTHAFVDNGNQSNTVDESLLPVFEGLTNLGDIASAEYLKDIFVNNTFDAVATANAVTKSGTKLVIADNGQTIKSTYSLDDFSTVPTAIDYELAVTTWYGQKIKFTKNLNIGLTAVSLSLDDPELEHKTLAYELEFDTKPQSLVKIYSDLMAQSTVTVDQNISAEEYLKMIFVDHNVAPIANLANGAKRDYTMIVIDANTGSTAYATFKYVDFDAVQREVVYSYSYKAWYGQEITITKTVKIDLPTYNFIHNNAFVIYSLPVSQPVLNAMSKSNVEPEYTWEDPYTQTKMTSFNVKKVDLNSAFWIVKNTTVDGVTSTTYITKGGSTPEQVQADADALAAEHLVRKFTSTNLAIKIDESNMLSYESTAEKVDVDGHLYYTAKVGANGTTEDVLIQSTFVEPYSDYYYGNYQVWKFDPIYSFVCGDEKAGVQFPYDIATLQIRPLEAKIYSRNVWAYISMFDKRNDEKGYELINREKLGWVTAEDGVDNGFGFIVDPDNGTKSATSAKSVYDLDITFELQKVDPEIASRVQLNSRTGELTFDNRQQLALVKNYDVNVKVIISYPQGVHSGNVKFKLTAR